MNWGLKSLFEIVYIWQYFFAKWKKKREGYLKK